MKRKLLSRVQLFVTPWTIQSMEFSRPEYWSWYTFPSPGNLSNPGIKPRSPALQVDSLPVEHQRSPRTLEWVSLLQWIFRTQESNQGLLHYRQILYQLSYQGSLPNHTWLLAEVLKMPPGGIFTDLSCPHQPLELKTSPWDQLRKYELCKAP